MQCIRCFKTFRRVPIHKKRWGVVIQSRAKICPDCKALIKKVVHYKDKIKLKKPCKRCGKMFQPTGKAEKLCKKCFDKSRKWRKS
jgi:hypothetical protein